VESVAEDAGKRWAILCLAIAVSATLIYQAGKLTLAWYWERSGHIAEQLRAANLVPENAEAWDHLGQTVEFNFDHADPARAIGYYLRAVKVDPRSANYWMDLALAYEATGHIARAKDAYETAQRDYPISAGVAWKYGNFLLRQGQTSEGLAEIHRALLHDSTLIPLAIRGVWNFDPNVQLILDDVLPASETAYFQALDFYVGIRQAEAALSAWERIVALSGQKPIDLKKSFPLLDELIAQDRAAAVQRVWREAVTASRWPEAPPVDHSIVWNGGFEAPIANGGLDWRFQQTSGAYISIDSTVHHSGSRSLRVGFTGGMNMDFVQVQQIEPAEPNTTYEFEAFVRTEDISTDSGIHFEIFDPEHQAQVYVLTPNMLGSSPWAPVRAEVTTAAQSHFLEIRLRRFPSRFFDSKIGGTVWIDDVTLAPKASVANDAQP